MSTLAAFQRVGREPKAYRGRLGASLGRGALFGLACTLPLAAIGAGLLQALHMLH